MSLQNVTLSYGPGIPAVGSVLFLAVPGSPLVYKPIGNQGKCKWNPKRKNADVTNQGTIWSQSIGTLIDAGTMSVQIHYIPGSLGNDPSGNFGHSFSSGGLGSVFISFQTTFYFHYVWPNGADWFFTGYFSDFPLDMDFEKDIVLDLNIQVSGQPIFLDA